MNVSIAIYNYHKLRQGGSTSPSFELLNHSLTSCYKNWMHLPGWERGMMVPSASAAFPFLIASPLDLVKPEDRLEFSNMIRANLMTAHVKKLEWMPI